MPQPRKSQTPHVIAFLRDHPNQAYSVAELEQVTGHSAAGLSREAAKPGSQVIPYGTRGMYMWTTTKQSGEPEVDPTNLIYIATLKDGTKVYQHDGKLYRVIFEEM